MENGRLNCTNKLLEQILLSLRKTDEDQQSKEISIQDVKEIDDLAVRRGVWWRAQIRSHKRGGNSETLKKALEDDFINGTQLSSFVATISFSCLLQDLKFDDGALMTELNWLLDKNLYGHNVALIFSDSLKTMIPFFGKNLFTIAFAVAIFYTIRSVYASLYKHLMFLFPSPGDTVATMKMFLREPKFADRSWWHLSPAFTGIKWNMFGATVGVLFHYGLFPGLISASVFVYLHYQLHNMHSQFVQAMEKSFDDVSPDWKPSPLLNDKNLSLRLNSGRTRSRSNHRRIVSNSRAHSRAHSPRAKERLRL